ncbi:MAG: hypothetical protein L6V85_04920 [Clostridiales bacterium]|nr:MAG: hypothetical protein L6V85_04920 [Clostridiales bacterium]
MAKRKRNIDFIAAQKAMGKSGQSTSFEFILVVTVVVVACAMVGWYLVARSQYNTAVSDLESAKTELTNQKNTLAKNEDKFKNFTVMLDKNGNPVTKGTDKYGNTIYQYESLTEVATRVANALAGAQATSKEADAAINLTGTIFRHYLHKRAKDGVQGDAVHFHQRQDHVKTYGQGFPVDAKLRFGD